MTALPMARVAGALLPALVAVSALRAQNAAPPQWHVAHSYQLGGAGGWDYLAVDSAHARVFVVRSDRVVVVDQRDGKRIGEIPGLQRGHGVAFDYATNHGFATSGEDGTVVMFDLGTLAVLKRTTAAPDADAILFDPASKRVFTFNGDAGTASAIDGATGERVGAITLGGKPEAGATDGAGHVYVNIEDRAEIVELDPAALTVKRRWSIAPCENPTGLALDARTARLFSVCGNALLVVSDVTRGAVVTTQPIGRGVDGAAFDAANGDVLASAGEGNITVVHEDTPDHYHVAATVPTMPGARTMTLDPKSRRVYTVSARYAPQPAGAPQPARGRRPIVPDSFTLLELER